MFSKGGRVALYCSDVAGAFDRVSAARLRDKLLRSGVHVSVVDVLVSWLEKRRARIFVDGAAFDAGFIDDCLPGHVLGPPLVEPLLC